MRGSVAAAEADSRHQPDVMGGVEGHDGIGRSEVVAQRELAGAPVRSRVGGSRPAERHGASVEVPPRLEGRYDLLAPGERVGLDLRVPLGLVLLRDVDRALWSRRRGFAGDACDSGNQAEEHQRGGEGSTHATRDSTERRG